MTRSEADRWFEEFLRTRDPRALGRLFDVTAPELYKVARYLAGDRDRAEDLVQATFLTAIESATSFRSGERVVPWLLGILANRARHWRKRAARETAPARGGASEDPALVAERAEFAQALDATLQEIAAPYREVLVLHLQHGLAPKEIANALQRPDGTVRSQLARGLEHLRAALPAGFALGVAVLALAPHALAALRGRVLATAAPGAVAGASSLAGALIMKKLVAALAAVLLLGVGAWWLFARRAPDPAQDAERAGIASAGAARSGRIAAAPGESEAATRTPVGAASGSSTPATSLRVRVRYDDGSPAPGLVVESDRETNPSWDGLGRSRRTDENGVALFERVEPGELNVACERGGSAKVHLEQGASEQVELTIAPGLHVRGVVVDHLERPVADATVWLSGRAAAELGRSALAGHEVAHTDREGRFELLSVPPSRLIGAFARSALITPLARIDGRPGETVDVRIKLRKGRGGMLRGRVLDADGKPLPDAALQLSHGSSGWSESQLSFPTRTARSDEHGEFTFAGGYMVERLPLWVRAPGQATWLEYVPIHPDRENFVEVRLLRGAVVRGSVHDARGKPVAARIDARQEGVEPARHTAWQGPDWARPWCMSDAQGAFEIRAIRPGSVCLVIDRGDRAGATTTLTLADGEERTWDARLAPPPAIEGVVVDALQNPLAGFVVIADGGSGFTHPGRMTTGLDGRFVLPSCETDASYFVTVRGANELQLVDGAVSVHGVRAGGAPITIVVPDTARASATLTGRIVDWRGAPPAEMRLFATRRLPNGTCETSVNVDDPGKVPLEPGRFALGPLRPGTHDLTVFTGSCAQYLGAFELRASETRDAGTLALEQPATVNLSVREPDGSPMTIMSVIVEHLGGEQCFASEVRDGKATIVRGSGSYRLSSSDWRHAMWVREIRLEPGQELRLEIQLQTGILCRVELPPAARPEHVVHLVWRDARGQILSTETNVLAEGKPTLRDVCLAPGEYAAEVRDREGRTAVTKVLVSEARATSGTVTLALPR